MTADVAVVVPNFNGASILPGCLGALESQTLAPAQVVVVDNASSDGSLDPPRRAFGAVAALAEPRNRGFGGGANRGVDRVSAPLVAVLNSDAPPAPDRLERVTARHPRRRG